jgi:predicted negative regulator of RcsB-dependent stress response
MVKVKNFLIKFIQIASLAVVLAVLIILCSVLPDSNTRGDPGELPEPVPVQPIDTITGTNTQADEPNDSINAETLSPENIAEVPGPSPAPVLAPAPAPTPAPPPAPTPAPPPAPTPPRTVASVNNQDKPAAVPTPGNVTNSGRGNSDRVIDEYTQAIQIDPNNAAVFHSRGFAYFNKGEYDLAIADFTKAIQIDPKNAVTFNNRGAAYNNKGNYDNAIADFDQAIRLNPDFENPYRHRAFAYLKKGDYKQARTDVNKAMQINPGYQTAQELSAELKRLGY